MIISLGFALALILEFWILVLLFSKELKRISEKFFGGKTPAEVLARRFKLFVLICIALIAASKLLYLHGILPANVELIIPTLVVIGSLSLSCGPTKFWQRVTRYFGLIALISVTLIDILPIWPGKRYWGPHPIYAFTWSGFILCWLLGMRHKLSMFDRFKRLLWRTTLTAAAAIIAFDLYTGVFGWSLVMGTGLAAAFLAQIPFALYHLCSLIFVPPLVGLAKVMVKVKVPVPVAIAVKRGVMVQA